MPTESQLHLSRRERQIMQVVYARREATVKDVLDDLADPPSYSSIRTVLNILERKGHLKHRVDGIRYVYRPTKRRSHASKAELQRVLDTFYQGDDSEAIEGILAVSGEDLSADGCRRISRCLTQQTAQCNLPG